MTTSLNIVYTRERGKFGKKDQLLLISSAYDFELKKKIEEPE